jgi:hypothetical protein
MIDIGSIAGLHEHDHQLATYCPRCDAWGTPVFESQGTLTRATHSHANNCSSRFPDLSHCH